MPESVAPVNVSAVVESGSVSSDAPGSDAAGSGAVESDVVGAIAVEVERSAEVVTEAEPPQAVLLFGDGIDQARRYVGMLVGDGVIRGLIGPREPSRIWTRHVLNCAVVAPLLPSAARVVDVGSGAGLPGIPWAIARPDCTFVLVEPLERRAIFLAEAIAALGLTNTRVVRGRAEDVIDDCGQADVVTSRAVAPLAKLARWSAPLVRHGGEIIAVKGAGAASEIQRDSGPLSRLGLKDLRAEEVGVGVMEETTFVIRATVDRAAAAGPGSKRGAKRRR